MNEPTEAESAAKDGLQIHIKAVCQDDGNPVFFYAGQFKGQGFSGTANDMNTAWSHGR